MSIMPQLRSLVLRLSGINRWKWYNRPSGLYCFNYHRIGDANNTPYDPNLFSCTANRFEQHVQFYKKHFDVVTIDDLLSIIEDEKPISERLALITFDDGYIDNYQLAYPILKRHRTPAAFFISTDYLDNPVVPWWDEIAWMVRRSDAVEVRLSSWECSVKIDRKDMTTTISNVLTEFKRDQGRTMIGKIEELKQLLGTEVDAKNAAHLFITWDMLKEMGHNSMDVGSHTCSHRVLSHLPEKDQAVEIKESKLTLESKLGKEIVAFAYPVGGRDSFTRETSQQVEKAGYKVGFSFIKGINRKVHDKRFELRRLGVENNWSLSELKSVAAFARHTW